jgi:hypothetical protein
MKVKTDVDQILMSDILKGQVPELDGEHIDELRNKHITIVAGKTIGTKTESMVGILRGIHVGQEPEIEFRCEIKEALDIIEASQLSFSGFALHHGEDRIVQIPGPFIVKAARIDEISPVDQLCTLGLHLMRPSR